MSNIVGYFPEGEGPEDQYLVKLSAGILRTAKWLQAQLPQHKASWKAPHEKKLNIDSGQFMLLPMAYQAAGMPAAAHEAMMYTAQEFAKDDGAGCLSPKCLAAGGFIPYAPSWHSFTAVQMGRPDIAHKIMRHVLPYQGRGKYGGFFDGPAQLAAGKGVFCFDSSNAAIIACLWSGHLEAARHGGEYLLRLDELSKGDVWVWTMTESGAAVLSHDDPAYNTHSAKPDKCTVVCSSHINDLDRGQGVPHWKTGFYLAACTYLYRTFSDERYLNAARRCFEWALRTAERKKGFLLWAHKLAWGVSEFYKETRDKRALDMAITLGQMLLRRQNAEGYFPYDEWFPQASGTPEPSGVTYSIAAQQCVWMSKVIEAVLLSRTPRKGSKKRKA